MSPHEISEAAALLRAGKLVAFPTETVYGLGANALDPSAVEKIFTAKGRPSTSPLIVHVDSIEMAKTLAAAWPHAAEQLARRFWPGPLTLVLPKRPHVPDIVTAGLPTVGLRMPAHPVALELIRKAQLPIAAPSANRFTELSPTTAGHVRQSLGSAAGLILDGGPATVGIESTVLSLAGSHPALLRPGMISVAQIEEVIGEVMPGGPPEDTAHSSPGLHPRHYRPVTPLFLTRGCEQPRKGRGAFLWITDTATAEKLVQMPRDASAYAAILYNTLHELDRQALDWIAVEEPPDTPDWAGVRDRLIRASQ